jgi:hypothetical protein
MQEGKAKTRQGQEKARRGKERKGNAKVQRRDRPVGIDGDTNVARVGVRPCGQKSLPHSVQNGSLVKVVNRAKIVGVNTTYNKTQAKAKHDITRHDRPKQDTSQAKPSQDKDKDKDKGKGKGKGEEKDKTQKTKDK